MCHYCWHFHLQTFIVLAKKISSAILCLIQLISNMFQVSESGESRKSFKDSEESLALQVITSALSIVFTIEPRMVFYFLGMVQCNIVTHVFLVSILQYKPCQILVSS